MLHFIICILRNALVRYTQVLIAITIYFYYALAQSPTDITIGDSDKLLHFIGNVMLCLSIWVATNFTKRYWIMGACLLPLAISVEAAQYIIPSRQFDLLDSLCNVGGIIFGCLIARYCQSRILTKNKPKHLY